METTTRQFVLANSAIAAANLPLLQRFDRCLDAAKAAKVMAKNLGERVGIYVLDEEHGTREELYPGELDPQFCSYVYPSFEEFCADHGEPNCARGDIVVHVDRGEDSDGFYYESHVIKYGNPVPGYDLEPDLLYSGCYVTEGRGWGSCSTATREEALEFIAARMKR